MNVHKSTTQMVDNPRPPIQEINLVEISSSDSTACSPISSQSSSHQLPGNIEIPDLIHNHVLPLFDNDNPVIPHETDKKKTESVNVDNFAISTSAQAQWKQPIPFSSPQPIPGSNSKLDNLVNFNNSPTKFSMRGPVGSSLLTSYPPINQTKAK